MNLPVGMEKEINVQTKDFNFTKKTLALIGEGFTGYIVVTTEGLEGIEEGVLFFKKGQVVGGLYEYNKHDVSVYGDKALPKIFNSSANPKGIVDVYLLTTQQLDLVTAFNEKVLVKEMVTKEKVQKLKPKAYDEKVAKEDLKGKDTDEESKYDILKRFGLGGLTRK